MEPPLLVRLFRLKPLFETQVRLIEGLQLILPRHDLDGSDEAHPISHPLHEHVIMSQPACQHNDIHVTLKHCGHATDLLRDLICHAFIDQPGFGVPRINAATHLPRITRSKMGDQSPLLRHLPQHALFRRSGSKAQLHKRARRQASRSFRCVSPPSLASFSSIMRPWRSAAMEPPPPRWATIMFISLRSLAWRSAVLYATLRMLRACRNEKRGSSLRPDIRATSSNSSTDMGSAM